MVRGDRKRPVTRRPSKSHGRRRSRLQAPRPRVRSTGYPSTLPAQVTSFVGREREIAEINQALTRTRLLTLTGSGGCGKTRLSLQVATGVLDSYADGVWLAELASLSNSSLVPKAVASALGIPEQPRIPLTETLRRHLRAKSLLLVLDNCEHLLAACAQLADALLRACPNLSILATSRESLGIAGELTYRVPGLSLPDRSELSVPRPERLIEFEAVRLFVERASFRQPGFAITERNAPAVAQVCSRLDGIPLAIELAAARVEGLSVEQIASRLDDRFRLLMGGSPTALPRHQTLRATMDWSYALLNELERGLLRRVSVFAGGFTLEAAESIGSGDGLAAPEVLGLLLRLIDRSMVISGERAGQSWYRLLETIRQYAWERLVETDEADEMQRRHLTWYLALAERADSKLRGQEQQVWLTRLEAEHDNLRAALDWGEKTRDEAEKGLRLAAALFWFWQLHGHWSEGRRWLEATNLLHGDASSHIGAKAVRWAALLAVQQGDFERAADLAQHGLTSARNSGDNESLIWCRDVLGQMAEKQGNYAKAVQLFEENLDLCRQLNDQWLLGHEISWLGFIARDERDYVRAVALHTEALALFRKMGDKHFTAWALRNLGVVALRLGDHKRADALCRESLSLSSAIGGTWQIEQGLMGLGGAATLKGQYGRGARLLGAAEALRTSIGRQRSIADQADFDKRVASTRAGLGEAVFAAAWAEGTAMPLEEAVAEALTPTEETVGTPPRLFTVREQEVVTLIAQGLTNRDIAARLVISERTVDTHVQRILNKLGMNSRVQVAAWFVQHGLQRSSPN